MNKIIPFIACIFSCSINIEASDKANRQRQKLFQEFCRALSQKIIETTDALNNQDYDDEEEFKEIITKRTIAWNERKLLKQRMQKQSK